MSALGMHREELPPDRRATSGAGEDDGDSLAEYLEIDPDSDDIENVQTEDGGMIVYLGEAVESPTPEDGEFFANLADGVLPDATMQRIATELLIKIEEDKEARKRRVEQYEEGIKRTGLGKDAPGGAQFEGASRVVHPGMTQGCIDYQSRIMKEMWPVKGPVKLKINGVVTKEKTARGTRKVDYMNFQLTEQMKEARTVTEKMLSQVPLGGSQFIRQTWDRALRRPKWSFVSIDKIFLPNNAADYESAHRKTYADVLTGVELKSRMNSGLYRDLELGRTAMVPDANRAQQAQAKVEGKDAEPSVNVDDEREIYEVQVLMEVTEDMEGVLQHEVAGELYPYIITIDLQSKDTLAFYRNWEPEDEGRQAIQHIFEFPFVTWDGAYGVGLPHIAGGLSGGATGALRALLDSAFIANSQGGLILKGSGTGGQTKQPQVGEFAEIDSGLETDDIRKKVMQFNTKEPSSVLFQLLGFLVEAQKEVVRTSMDDSAIDTNANTPVGTQLSRVEEGLVVFSAIHGRAHAAFNRLLAGLHRLNSMYLPDEPIRVDMAGKEVMVRRRDFQGPPDVQPVSDPTIYSEQQRMAQITAMQQRAAMAPGLYDIRKVEERFLQIMKVPNYEELLVKVPEPQEQNAINENLAMGLGRPVVAFPDQDHLAHLQAHFDFSQSPFLGSNPLIAPKFLPLFVQHVAEHILYHYVKSTTDLIEHTTNMEMAELMSSDPEVKEAFDRLLALSSQKVVPSMQEDFANAMPIIQKAMQMLQSMAPKPPIDPAQAALQASTAETQRKQADDKTSATLDQQKNAIMAERNRIQEEGNQSRDQTSITRTVLETRSAQDIGAMRLTEGKSPGFTDGSSLGG